MALSLTGAKLTAMFVQIVILGGFCVMPIWVSDYFYSKPWGNGFLTCCKTFGGGSLLGLYMIHQTPEINYLMTEALPDIDYPIAELIAGAGFFFFNFMQFTVNYIKAQSAKKSLIHETTIANGTVSDGEINLAFDKEKEAKEQDHKDNNTKEKPTFTEISETVTEKDTTVYTVNKTTTIDTKPQDEPAVDPVQSHVTNVTGARSIILLIALCFDGFFQGLAIGLQRSYMQVIAVLIGIVCHEFAIAFTLGLELLVTHTKKMHMISGLVYAGTPAIGVIVGLVIYVGGGDDLETTYLVNGILQCLATGTFVYVIVVGILGRELQNPRLPALLTCLFGFCLLSVLRVFHPEEEGDGSENATVAAYGPLTGNFIPLYQRRYIPKYS